MIKNRKNWCEVYVTRWPGDQFRRVPGIRSSPYGMKGLLDRLLGSGNYSMRVELFGIEVFAVLVAKGTKVRMIWDCKNGLRRIRGRFVSFRMSDRQVRLMNEKINELWYL